MTDSYVAEIARRALADRRRREAVLPSAILGEPAWDMILDLTASMATGRNVSITDLCLATAVPTSTALRKIGKMCEAGLIERAPDPDDGRRTYVRLTDDTFAAMRAHLLASQGGGGA